MNPPQSTHLRETAGRECSKLYRPCAYNYYCRTYELSCVFWQPVRHSLFRTRACASPAPRATARRCDSALPDTSTISAAPASLTWLSLLIG